MMGLWKTLCLPLVGSILLGVANARVTLDNPVDVPRTYMVEFVDEYDAASFYSKLVEESIPATSRLNLTYSLFKGASFELSTAPSKESIPNRIAKLPMVRKIWPVQTGRIPEDETIWEGSAESAGSILSRRQSGEVDNVNGFAPHRMTQVDKLRAENVTGKGIRIALVDTGVDYTHPALGGCFGEGCLVGYGTDYVGDYLDQSAAQVPMPDDDPYDGCNGHGTHIAGIIAAQENPLGFTGVAPGVTIGAYRVTSCGGRVHSDIYIAAFNQAFEDGSDIITTSTLFDSEWPEHPVAALLQRIVESGVPCIGPVGNFGSEGLFSTKSPGVGRGVSAVASAMNLEYPLLLKKATYVIEDEDEEVFGYQAGRFGDFRTEERELWLLDDDDIDGCESLPEGTPDLTDYIVLVSDDEGCPVYNKTAMIMALGGRNVMAYSSNFTTYELRVFPLAVQGLGMVPQEVGEVWVEALKEGKTITLSTQKVIDSEDIVYSPENPVSHGYITTSSSWGLSLELDAKPQFAAPGGNILSLNPVRMGGYAIKSGTSMASPFAAGLYALLAEVRGTTDPAELTNILASTANANQWFDGEELHEMLAPVPQQGAGLIQIHDAAHVKTLLSTSAFSFNDTDNFIPEAEFTIENQDEEEVTYALSHVPAVTVYASEEGEFHLAPFPNPTVNATASLEFSGENITVGAGESVKVTVIPTPPSADEIDEGRMAVYSGFIALNGTNGDALSIPYVGVAGSMRSLPIFDSSIMQYWDVQQTGVPVPENTTFTFPEPEGEPTDRPPRNVPYASAVVSRTEGTALLYGLVEAVDADVNTTEVLGEQVVGSLPGFPRQFMPTGIDEVAFTGMLSDGTVVPAGSYRLVFKALKILGDREDVEDYHTLRLEAFVLEYGEADIPTPTEDEFGFPIGIGR